MEAWLGKVEGEVEREMIVMLKLEVARRALRISVPIVPLAFGGGVS
jgi:hypothetical protein